MAMTASSEVFLPVTQRLVGYRERPIATCEHHRDGQFYPAFQKLIDAAEVTRVPLPPRLPNLNAYAERWVRSVKKECLSRLIRFGEASLRHALTQ